MPAAAALRKCTNGSMVETASLFESAARDTRFCHSSKPPPPGRIWSSRHLCRTFAGRALYRAVAGGSSPENTAREMARMAFLPVKALELGEKEKQQKYELA
jgi:hypothetical protein